jgi:threonine/homoserine/homoserine lactone efflux protein
MINNLTLPTVSDGQRNFISGFIVSLIGTLPLGVLNLFALQIKMSQSVLSLFLFIMGVITYEMAVIRLMLYSAKWLLSKTKLLFYLEIFTLLFLLICAISNLKNNHQTGFNEFSTSINPYLFGILMSFLNPMQFPFWAGWNLYLIQNHKLNTSKSTIFILGAGLGTTLGMLIFVLSAQYLTTSYITSKISITTFFSIFFFVLAFLQALKITRKLLKS